jgi:hypothetical protein
MNPSPFSSRIIFANLSANCIEVGIRSWLVKFIESSEISFSSLSEATFTSSSSSESDEKSEEER